MDCIISSRHISCCHHDCWHCIIVRLWHIWHGWVKLFPVSQCPWVKYLVSVAMENYSVPSQGAAGAKIWGWGNERGGGRCNTESVIQGVAKLPPSTQNLPSFHTFNHKVYLILTTFYCTKNAEVVLLSKLFETNFNVTRQGHMS